MKSNTGGLSMGLLLPSHPQKKAPQANDTLFLPTICKQHSMRQGQLQSNSNQALDGKLASANNSSTFLSFLALPTLLLVSFITGLKFNQDTLKLGFLFIVGSREELGFGSLYIHYQQQYGQPMSKNQLQPDLICTFVHVPLLSLLNFLSHFIQ